MRRGRGPRQDRQQIIGGEIGAGGRPLDGELHGVDVGENLQRFSAHVAAGIMGGLGTGEATRITGLAIMEAMREAEPGMPEYELQAVAEYVFKKYGSQGAAYFALVATGPNTVYSHYHRNSRVLADDDLVQFDYAPD